MKAFIAYSLERDHLDELKERLDLITLGANDANYDAYAHVRDGQNWVLGGSSIPEMMKTVFNKIEEVDVVILDLTSNANSRRTGLNIELGYALAFNKKVIALYRKGERPNMNTDLALVELQYSSDSEIRELLRKALLEVN